MNAMNGFMLDTNAFNDVLDGRIDIAYLKAKKLAVTHVQRDEINATTDEARRNAILSIFRVLVREEPVADRLTDASGDIVPTDSAAWGVTRWGMAKWGFEDRMFEQLRLDLDVLNKGKKNNVQDALIAETALRNGYVLVTADSDLFAVVTKHGGACMNISAVLGIL
ncbi:MAG: hypothetical protein E6R11_07645 [Rhodocyclaceae bacterium]|jgi:rRNA-processing protein FCF1|nr:MAG: hypothetical protein E6R11_07645 [Rhodocyclaceae bacterium]